MNKFLRVTAVGLTAFGIGVGGALATAAASTHVRGTIEQANANTLAVKTYGGNTVDLALTPTTKFAWVEKSSLSSIKKGDFIGTAATGSANDMVAQEVVIFPGSMRGTGEGHYPWTMPAAVAAADTGGASTGGATGAPPVQGTMTNGTVAATSTPSSGSMVQGTMTNGTVAANTAQSGGKELTISYGSGKTVRVLVPPTAPVVRFVPSQKSAVTHGAHAFISAEQGGNGKLSANFVAVGKSGLVPPM